LVFCANADVDGDPIHTSTKKAARTVGSTGSTIEKAVPLRAPFVHETIV
jgi:hypothetical protein